jgi:hypothetical protein
MTASAISRFVQSDGEGYIAADSTDTLLTEITSSRGQHGPKIDAFGKRTVDRRLGSSGVKAESCSESCLELESD